MPSPNSVFTELTVTTFRKHRKELKDNLTRNNALLSVMEEKKLKRTEDGGTTITCPLDYAENSTYQRYSGYDVLNIGASETSTAAEYPWRQIAINITASGRDLRINSGDSRIINLVKMRMKNAMRTFKNNFSFDVYSDGTLPNQINGLQALVSDSGTNTIGGIDANVWSFWRNRVQSAAAPIQGGGAVTVSATTIENLMMHLWMAQTRGDDQPDLLVADNNYFGFFEQSQTSLKRYTDDTHDEASGGFVSLKYKKAKVIYDGGSGIPVNRMYSLNTDYLEQVVHPQADMEILDEANPYNQDAVVIPILWMGNLVCSNRALQGVIRP